MSKINLFSKEFVVIVLLYRDASNQNLSGKKILDPEELIH